MATHGAAHNQEFEIECLVPKLDIQVFGTGGSRRAGEQAAAKQALEAVQLALVKSPAATRRTKPRTAQLKLAGIATSQADLQTVDVLADAPGARPGLAKTDAAAIISAAAAAAPVLPRATIAAAAAAVGEAGAGSDQPAGALQKPATQSKSA